MSRRAVRYTVTVRAAEGAPWLAGHRGGDRQDPGRMPDPDVACRVGEGGCLVGDRARDPGGDRQAHGAGQRERAVHLAHRDDARDQVHGIGSTGAPARVR